MDIKNNKSMILLPYVKLYITAHWLLMMSKTQALWEETSNVSISSMESTSALTQVTSCILHQWTTYWKPLSSARANKFV
jgi:hypothetical protein